MTLEQIARRRLGNQHLFGTTFEDPADVVRSLGAVQSQDYNSAKWALGQRARGIGDSDVERSFATGAILRTHVLRPTWHFVVPEDIRWMLFLTGPRVKARMATYERTMGLGRDIFRRSNTAIERALRGGTHLTRAELVLAIGRARVKVATGQHAAHILMQAELDGVVCSGARRGKQFTYALLEERVPAAPAMSRDESLAELARRYFMTRGPATAQDFAWWSGLSVGDSKRGAEAAGSSLRREVIDDRVHWSASGSARRRAARTAHLLPNYDEYFVGFRDRGAIGVRLRRIDANRRIHSLMGHLAFIDGQIVGGWRRALRGDHAVTLDLVVPVKPAERRLLDAAAARFAKFLGD